MRSILIKYIQLSLFCIFSIFSFHYLFAKPAICEADEVKVYDYLHNAPAIEYYPSPEPACQHVPGYVSGEAVQYQGPFLEHYDWAQGDYTCMVYKRTCEATYDGHGNLIWDCNYPFRPAHSHAIREFCVAQPICECDENVNELGCENRTLTWNEEPQSLGQTGAEIFTSDANNQGLQCGRLIEDEVGCNSEAAIFNLEKVGNPINCSNGEKTQTETDYRSVLGALGFTRSYKKTPSDDDILESEYNAIAYEGMIPENVQIISNPRFSLASESPLENRYGWSDNLPRLQRTDPGITTLIKGDNFLINFHQGQAISPRHGTLSTTTDPQGNLLTIYRSISGQEYHFDSEDRLLKIQQRNGQFQQFSYPADRQTVITDNFNRNLVLDYADTTRQRLIRMTDPDGYQYRFEYENGLLSKVIYPDATPNNLSDNPYKTYEYDADGGLIKIYDELGSLYGEWAYDDQGRAILSQHAGGAGKVEVLYHPTSNNSNYAVSTVRHYRNESGHRREQIFFTRLNGNWKPTRITPYGCTNCDTQGTHYFEYDENGYLLKMRDGTGASTSYVYNDRGLLENVWDPVGYNKWRKTTTVWHSDYKLPLSVDTPTSLTSYQYDVDGNLLSMAVQDKATGETRSTTYTYNNFGQVLTIDGPRIDVNDLITFEYDTGNGNLLKVTNTLGHVTHFAEHDAEGRPLLITDANGIDTSLTYHPRGWISSQTYAGLETQYHYNAAGLVTQVLLPNGSELNYEYDQAQRVVAIEDTQGNRMDMVLDDLGNVTDTEVKDPQGQLAASTRQVYNDFGHLKETFAGGDRTQSLSYDRGGRPMKFEDGLDHRTYQFYTESGQVRQILNARMTYDMSDRLTRVTAPNYARTDYTYNGFDELLTESSPDRGTLTYTYDAAGNLTTSTDAKNQTTAYTYDALDRVTQIAYADGEIESYQYDHGAYAKGRLSSLSDSSGSVSYAYTARGELASKTQVTLGQSLVTQYSYDNLGQLNQMTYPSGLVLDFTYDQGEFRSVNVNGQSFISGLQYYPFGPVESWQWSDNSVYQKTFDQKGQLVSHPLPFNTIQGATSDPDEVLRTLTYDLAGRITEYDEGADAIVDQSFTYDAVSRLTGLLDHSGLFDRSYEYDYNGNRKKTTDQGTGAIDTYAYLYGSNKLSTLRDPEGLIRYQYDDNGNTLFDGKHSLTYDGKNRFTSVVTDDNQFVQYQHNGLGQRVAKTTATGTTLYNYSESGQLLGEYNADGTAISETIYLFGQPVGVYRNNTLYRVYADHLGTPRVITTNPIDTVTNPVETVWQWNSDPFGTLPVDSDPDGDGVEFVFNQRMPGQYYDAETGYFYNYFRTYDPSTGRYLQSDPIGLAGGTNTYGYVGGDPIGFTDPLGLNRTGQHTRPREIVRPRLQPVTNARVRNLIREIRLYDSNYRYPTARPISGRTSRYNNRDVTYLEQVLTNTRQSPRCEGIFSTFPRTGSANKVDGQHGFSNIVDNYVPSLARRFNVPTRGRNGKIIRYSDLYQLEGGLRGNRGVFEWVVDHGNVTHRRFIPNGRVTGYPNQRP